ncbi:MAG: ATP-dependent helicase [Actinomycetota bacterium]
MSSQLPLEPDDEQARVLEHGNGALLVTGGPGSGKTSLLRRRFARLADEAGAEKVALFVLDRRAARAARDELTTVLERSLPDLAVFTPHGFAFRVLGRRFGEAGYAEPPQVLSAPEQYALVRELLAAEDASAWPSFGPLLEVGRFVQQVADFLLRAQERLLSPDELAKAVRDSGRKEYQEAAAFYGRYLEALAAAGRVDFAGLLFQTAALLRRDLSEEEAFLHVMVDDYQDTTVATEAILGMLGAASDSVVIAADPPGSVFAYKGGSREPLGRVDSTFPGLQRVELRNLYRRGVSAEAISRLDHGDPLDEDVVEHGLEARVFDHPGQEADFAAHEILRARVEEGIGWEDQAILVRRYGEYVTALRQALTRHGVPFVVVAEASEVATEPANRPVIDVFRYVLRRDDREALIERVLLSPVVGLDPHQLRRLRREARLRRMSITELVHGPHVGQLDGDLSAPLAAFAALVEELERDPDRAPDAMFADAWERLDWFRRLVEAEDRPRDLDALAALSEVLSRFVERRPEATMQEYLDTLDAAEFGPDPWTPAEERRPHAVRIVSAHRAHGMEFERVLVVGCLEGEFPSLAHAPALVDLETVIARQSPRERLRERLATERALFRLAVSRAARGTVLTASLSTSARNPRTPSRFAERIGLEWKRSVVEAPAASLLTLEASLRKVVADTEAPAPERLGALAALPAAGALPGEWWGSRDWSDPDLPLHPDEIRTSYSRLSTLQNCALQYLYSSEMGLDGMDRSHSMWLGSVVHDIIDRVHKGRLEKSLDAMLAALEEAWSSEAFPFRALERQRHLDAKKMLRQWLADETTGDAIASEVGFEFPVDGAVMRGKIDAVFPVGEGGVRILDYKTSKRADTQDQVRRSLQLAAYYLAMRRVPELAELGEPRVLELAFLFVEGQDGGYKHVSTTPDRAPDELEFREYEDWAEETIKELLALVRSESFAPNPEANCMWCDFQSICPVWPQGAEVGS